MRVIKLYLGDFRLFNGSEVYFGKRLTAIAGNNGTGKSTILGLLANSSALKGKKSLLGKQYRGEFSELFRADKSHDPTGTKVRLDYEERGIKCSAEFRTGWQKGNRFRIIPKRIKLDGSKTESKVESPVIYLGLSRLYPVGETSGDVTAKGYHWKDPSDGQWFTDNYARILSIHDDIKSVSSMSLPGIASKRGTGVETDGYGPVANSAGQDNLGQILLAVLSFKKLKNEIGEDWDGGLLLIDEVDAALHPAAQIRLVKLLMDESKSVGFQVIFTTHSTVLLEELSKKNQHNPNDEPGNVEVVYFSTASRDLRVKRNPSWQTVENDLYVTNSALNRKRVGIFTEDAEARWFIKGLLDALRPDAASNVDLLDISLGCDQMFSLYRGDFSYFRDRVVVFDGDVAQKEINEKLPPALLKSGANVVRLPGDERPENVIWDYLKRDPENGDLLWEELDNVGIQWASLVESSPDHLYPDDDERNRYKKWLKTYQDFFDRAHVIEHWSKDNDEEAQRFIDDFLRAYNNVAKRLGAAELSMAKRRQSI